MAVMTGLLCACFRVSEVFGKGVRCNLGLLCGVFLNGFLGSRH